MNRAVDTTPRSAFDRRVVAIADPVLSGITRHWLFIGNAAIALFLLGAIAAPVLEAIGQSAPAGALYDFYHAACHQWAFRSFFLFGPRPVYDQAMLSSMQVDPYTFVGTAATGWKMAICERDVAIYGSLVVFAVLYGLRWRPRGLTGCSYLVYVILITPMALDGFTQLFGWRESTWELRVATGLLFGLASGWLMYPRLNESFAKGLA